MKKQVIPNQAVTIKAVAFDMDGLLINTEDLYEIVGDRMMQRRGKMYREEVRQKMIGLPAPQAFAVLIEAEGLTESWQELQAETDAIFEELLEHSLRPMEGAHELLELIERLGLPRCVATSSNSSFAKKALSQVGFFERLDFVVTAAEVSRGKPHPDIYQEAARRMGVDPWEMLVLEDSENGTKAGVSAQAFVVSVPNKHTASGDFSGASFVSNSLRDDRIKELLNLGQTE